MRRDELIRRLQAQRPLLKKYRVKRLRVFGSVARDEATDQSDVDLIVDYEVKPDLIGFIALMQDLSDALGVKVDLATPESLRPELKDDILAEAIDAQAA